MSDIYFEDEYFEIVRATISIGRPDKHGQVMTINNAESGKRIGAIHLPIDEVKEIAKLLGGNQ